MQEKSITPIHPKWIERVRQREESAQLKGDIILYWYNVPRAKYNSWEPKMLSRQ